MNIFQIFQTQGNIDQSLFAGIIQYQNHWLNFKEIIDNLFANNDFNRSKTIQLWCNIYMSSQNLVRVIIEYYRCQFDIKLNNTYIVEINAIINNKKDSEKCTKLFEYINKIYNLHKQFLTILSENPKKLSEKTNMRNSKKLVQSLTSKLKIILLEKIDFHTIIQQFFRIQFLKHSKCVLNNSIIQFSQETHQLINDKTKDIVNRFERNTIKKALYFFIEIDLYQKALNIISNISSVNLNEYIKGCQKYIEENTQFLKKCEIYFETFHHNFELMIQECLNQILVPPKKNEYINKLKKNQDKYKNNIYFFYSKLCIKKIFDIVLEFPENYQIVAELKKCIEKSNMLNDLSDFLIDGIEKRLLIPGVITQNILSQYINMLKVLQILDPNGVIFDKITTPIKNYLLKRKDTLRCIISHLTQGVQNYSNLIKEVVKIPAKEHFDEMSSDQDQQAAQKWQVLPLMQKKSQIRVKYQQIDLVTVLVNLYGSQQAFINEYQNMLAQKLMSAKDFNIDEQIKNLQLLKLRFGQSSLQTCNIIVKDVKDSKRTDNLIHKQNFNYPGNLLKAENLHCLAVSKGYWPINYEATAYTIPNNLKSVFQQYANKFMQIKAMRKIQWHYNLGYVNLSLTFDNGEFKFKCLPIHAILISYFDQSKICIQNGVPIDFLAKELNLSHNIIKQRMSFWIHKSVIKENKVVRNLTLKRMNSFQYENQLIFYLPVKVLDYKQPSEDDILYDQTDQMISKQSTSLESHLIHIIEGLILSILNTNGPKTAEKIHLLLKTVYKTDLNYNFGEPQTKQILKKMVARKKIIFKGDGYQVNKI